MKTQSVNVEWKSDMAFNIDAGGYKLMVDADEKVGGTNQGPRPKQLLLAAAGGCTGMDVISILKKMHIVPDYFNIRVEGEIMDVHPMRFTKIHLIYEFKGDHLPMEQLEKAIKLSQEKYCSVSATLKQSVEITTAIKILEKE